ncbi:hypothetical protein AJ78_08645 [Emergomyces pasteurianus Ep9510]|uniref:Uncharacterized protein n=1 Tax=Emergomyces pasteurianus Ep9510 TaxID=1447872 RepID=A0A1J9P0E6_9EURO|nr:hypothetical protein AJ78_08645 [Emergomyces pasteurianus Ep9510]
MGASTGLHYNSYVVEKCWLGLSQERPQDTIQDYTINNGDYPSGHDSKAFLLSNYYHVGNNLCQCQGQKSLFAPTTMTKLSIVPGIVRGDSSYPRTYLISVGLSETARVVDVHQQRKDFSPGTPSWSNNTRSITARELLI